MERSERNGPRKLVEVVLFINAFGYRGAPASHTGLHIFCSRWMLETVKSDGV